MSEFRIYPALDFLGGRCVRLYQGEYGSAAEVSTHPLATAETYLQSGCRYLHVVDLDAARSPKHIAQTSVNLEIIRDICRLASTCNAKVQVGGGVRSLADLAAWLEVGASRCVVGTAAREEGFLQTAVERFGAEAVVVGLDGRDGKLAVQGWEEQTNQPLIEVAVWARQAGVRTAVVTDVRKDGTGQGPNLQIAREIAEATGLSVIASGGVAHLDHVQAVQKSGLAGVIVGKALYSGQIELSQVAAWWQSEKGDVSC
ncbi:1-(5-phosphoribosyl)-5-[(5-phosphoribosylamino)methylideneamino] imidazole-4-carboxamide isomerase [Alicyclobacillus sp. TC]|uniref:1-(5-phosphoribosyl)-5-[(5- phosphoribosylamino)methylideneamino]imidazole-4- carboxamide isomerase n=1 Tax=Alicyclobacillus sp. TC TaxID=2606450 RepID=UPI0019348B1C|nr:1-(5-phosphoribosyl)-5-[(5-phosphoribosylamino)methylideneamino] imidazole-4-carboxamide isomerase [Alicyclobacillus sp. TC]QRF24064.1 1-(5-phosphoribosyl)-5-[(5-phosphoribosylamino)methylideneamino] imidazole-4-carboxamide isomerase [Alicyclobacillus sp. TC]